MMTRNTKRALQMFALLGNVVWYISGWLAVHHSPKVNACDAYLIGFIGGFVSASAWAAVCFCPTSD